MPSKGIRVQPSAPGYPSIELQPRRAKQLPEGLRDLHPCAGGMFARAAECVVGPDRVAVAAGPRGSVEDPRLRPCLHAPAVFTCCVEVGWAAVLLGAEGVAALRARGDGEEGWKRCERWTAEAETDPALVGARLGGKTRRCCHRCIEGTVSPHGSDPAAVKGHGAANVVLLEKAAAPLPLLCGRAELGALPGAVGFISAQPRVSWPRPSTCPSSWATACALEKLLQICERSSIRGSSMRAWRVKPTVARAWPTQRLSGKWSIRSWAVARELGTKRTRAPELFQTQTARATGQAWSAAAL